MDQAMESSDSDQENNNTSQRQSSQQRKLLYRDLLNKVESIQERDDLGLDVVKEIGAIIKQVNKIEIERNTNERFQHPDETLLDTMVLSSASSTLVKCVESVDVNTSTYNASEFTNNIKMYVSEDEEFVTEDLLKLLSDAQQIIPQIPDYHYIYGSYDLSQLPQPKKRKERQKQQKEQYQRKEPEKITTLDKEEPGVDETVKILFKVLTDCYERNHENPIKYYDYVIDTNSFSNTVENMFYCSFLIRDGKAKLDLDNKGVPYIKPMKKRELKEFRDEHGINSQVISTITIPEWENFKQEGYIQKYKNMKK